MCGRVRDAARAGRHDGATTAGAGGGTGTGTTSPKGTGTATGGEEPEYSTTPEDFPAEYEPAWVHETPTGDPSRDLDRLLDRFRDDIRDAARDHGVTEAQLRDARRHLSTAAAHIGVILRAPRG